MDYTTIRSGTEDIGICDPTQRYTRGIGTLITIIDSALITMMYIGSDQVIMDFIDLGTGTLAGLLKEDTDLI